MKLGGFDGLFFRVCESISRIAYVNVLWFTFAVLGLGVFGWAPATVALFAVTRKWQLGEKDIPIFSTYWTVYKKEFLKSNLLGILLLAAGFILYVDLAYLPTTTVLFTFVRYAIVAISFVYLVLLLYIFPVYVHFQGSIKTYLKNALVLGLSFPHFTFMMLIGAAILYTGLSLLPGLIPFFSLGLLGYMIMRISLLAFSRAEASRTLKTAELET